MMFCIILLLVVNTNLALGNNCVVQFGTRDVVCNCTSVQTPNPEFCPDNTTILYIRNNIIDILMDFTFSKFHNLQYLNLDNCNITRINEHAFHNLTRLETLSIAFNPIARLLSNVFEPLNSLQELWISHTLLSSYPINNWDDLSGLKRVNTHGGPENETFSKVFSAMKSLDYFHHYTDCNMMTLHNYTLISFTYVPIRTIYLECNLRHIEIDGFVPLKKLKVLLLPYQEYLKLSNVIASLHAFKDKVMDMINLSSCFRFYGEYILTANMMAAIGNICVKSFQFSDNGLQMIDSSGLQKMKYIHCFEHIIFSRNKFDYHQLWIIAFVKLFSNLKTLDISFIHGVYGDELHPSYNSTMPFISKNKQPSILVGLPESLEVLNASYIQSHVGESPKSITVAGGKNLRSVDFTATTFDDCNYTYEGLQSVISLNISKFNCQHLHPNILHSCTNLQQFVMQKSFLNIGLQPHIQGRFLKGLTQLRLIDLSDNRLESFSIEHILSDQFNSLKVLILKNNLLDSFPTNIAKLLFLDCIDLRNNKIQYLTDENLSDLEAHINRMRTTEFSLLLNGNPLLCNCDSLTFLKWIFTTDIKFDKSGSYPCLYLDGSVRNTIDIYEHIDNLQVRCIPRWLYILAAVSCATIIGVLCIASIIYRYRFYIYLWILNKKERLAISNSEEQCNIIDNIYDGVILYADTQNDGNWVKETLWIFLFNHKKYNIALEHEDTESGSVELSNILQLCKRSKRLIFVVSSTFLSDALEEVICDQIIKEMKEKHTFVIDFGERRHLTNSIGICLTKSNSCHLDRNERGQLHLEALQFKQSADSSNSNYFIHSFWRKLGAFMEND